jgi:Nitroreductase family.
MKRRHFLVGTAAVIAGAAGVGVYCAQRASADYDRYSRHLRRPLDPAGGIDELVRMATLAPNGHNTQPWKFAVRDRALVIAPDFSRRTPVVDPDDHHLFVSLGAAAQNAAIAGAAMGLPGEISADANGTLHYVFTNGRPVASPLTEAIVRRQSTRSEYDGRTVDTATLAALEAAGRAEGVRLVLVTARRRMNAIRDLVVAGNDRQMADPAFVAELKSWLRFSPASAMAHGDGLYAAASGNPSLPDFLGRPAFDLVFKPKSENAKYARQIDSSAGLAIFLGDRADKLSWIAVGRAMQRFLLEATRHGVACAFVNQPVEVAALRPQLASLLGESVRPDLVIRFGYGKPLPYSPRREQVFAGASRKIAAGGGALLRPIPPLQFF